MLFSMSFFLYEFSNLITDQIDLLVNVVLITFLILTTMTLKTSVFEVSLGFFSVKYTFSMHLTKFFLLFLSLILIFYTKDLFLRMSYYLLNFFEHFFFFFSFLIGLFLLMVSNSFMIFFFTIEIVSFSLYYMIISKNNKLIGVEASLKYFIFSLISSGFILQALVLFYGFFGIGCFFELFLIISFFSGYFFFYYLFLFSTFLLLLGFLFKLALAPLHFWSPDVLEIVTYGIFIFFVLFTKVIYFLVLLRFFLHFNFFFSLFYFALIFVCFYSMIIGILGSLFQHKIKRFLAYSSIFHGGFFLISFIGNFFLSIVSFVFYFIYYSLFYLCFLVFLSINHFYNNKYFFSNLYELHIYKQNPYLSICILILLFFLMGIPPLVGFFTKYVFIMTLVFTNAYFFSFMFFLLSIVAVFYYLKVVRIFFLNKISEYAIIIFNYKYSVLSIYIFFFLFFFFFEYSEIFTLVFFHFKINAF